MFQEMMIAAGGGGGNAMFYDEEKTNLTTAGWTPDIVVGENSTIYVYDTIRQSDFWSYALIVNGTLINKYNPSGVVQVALTADNKFKITTNNGTARVETWRALIYVVE